MDKLSLGIFPFPSVTTCYLSPKKANTDLVDSGLLKVIRRIYRQCKKNNSPHSASHPTKRVYFLDLTNKQISLRFGEEGKYGRVMKIAIHLQGAKVGSLWVLPQKWTFTLMQEGESAREEVYEMPHEARIEERKFPFYAFNGGEVEAISYADELSKEDPTFWDDWKERDQTAERHYRSTIYPLFKRAVNRIGDVREKPLTILDVGGGDGELACLLAESEYVREICTIDASRPSIESAKKRKDAEKCRFIVGDVRDSSFLEILEGKAPDIILLSGVVATQVLFYEEAYALMLRLREILCEEGYFLIASHSASHFTRTTYEEMGYHVLNTTGFSIDREGSSISQIRVEGFYVLQK